jgi:hypothetical protein
MDDGRNAVSKTHCIKQRNRQHAYKARQCDQGKNGGRTAEKLLDLQIQKLQKHSKPGLG